mgnify:CR=1 FL=1
MADVFTSELAFEDVLVEVLEKDYGWRNGTLSHPTEQDLLDNWAQILFENNKGQNRLNGCPLTQGEMAQIMEQIAGEMDIALVAYTITQDRKSVV